MAVTKTNFINYSRCRRYVALDEVKKERLNADVSYEEYKDEELKEEIKNIVGEMYSEDEEGNEIDNIDVEDPQLKVMLPYYKEIEMLAGKKVEHLFGGKTIYSLDTKTQESFDFDEDGIKYLCYVDIYNEQDDEINIIEVKATTSNKYLSLEAGYRSTAKEKHDKFSIFYKDSKGIFHLKEDNKSWNMLDEMPESEYRKKRNKLLDKYDPCGKYIYDLSVQRMIIEGDLKQHNFTNKKINYYLAVLNHEYVFDGTYKDGKAYYTDDIISIFDYTKLTEEALERVYFDKKEINSFLKNMDLSPCNLGNFCEYKKPSKCKFCKLCMKHIPKYNSSLSYMNNGCGFKDEYGDTHKGLDLINEGYINLLDIPESWIKNPNHFIQRDALITGKPYINKLKLKQALDNIKYPIYHLDFETFPCPLPRFRGEKCYRQSPFQFSLHIERTPGVCDKELDHYEFLSSDPTKDEREELVKKLVEYIKPDGTLFAQNVPFEKGRIKELSEIFTEYKDDLLKIYETGSDLLYIVKGNKDFYKSIGYDEEEAKIVNFYDSHLSGSYSIKKTLPVFSDLKYDDLDVKNGTQALVTYAMFSNMTKEELDFKYHSLLEYCKQDTWAMVVILDKIRKMVE